jgi:hypothetical protein
LFFEQRHFGGYLDIWTLLSGELHYDDGFLFQSCHHIINIHPASITPYAWEQLQPLLKKNNLLTAADGTLHLVSRKDVLWCTASDMRYRPLIAYNHQLPILLGENRVFLGYRTNPQDGALLCQLQNKDLYD